MKIYFIRPLLILLFFYGYHTVYFAQQLKIDFRELSKGADLILTAKVTEQTSAWNEDKTRIYTNATLRVEEYLKGNNSEAYVTVTYPGGEVGDVGEIYSHMPRFENNEEVLVFLKRDEKSSNYKVFNGENGIIRLMNDPLTGEKVTTSNVEIIYLKTQIKNSVE